MNLSGFSAVYPGYQAAENTQAEVEKNQAAAKEAAFKLLGAQVLGRALTGAQPPAPGAPGQPQGQPMAPPPGQPSMPNQPPPQAGPAMAPGPGVASQPAVRPPMMPAQGAPGAPPAQGGSGLPEISLPALTQRILQTTPQIKDHPEVLLAALERAAPLLDRASKDQLYDMRPEMQKQQLEARALGCLLDELVERCADGPESLGPLPTWRDACLSDPACRRARCSFTKLRHSPNSSGVNLRCAINMKPKVMEPIRP
mgnify:CR=1 FL=1